MSDVIFTIDDGNTIIRVYPSHVPGLSGSARRAVIAALLPSLQALAKNLGRVTGSTWTVVDAEAQDEDAPQVTGETITDEQISEQLSVALDNGDREAVRDCKLALRMWHQACDVCRDGSCARCIAYAAQRRAASARCAAAYNARFGAKP